MERPSEENIAPAATSNEAAVEEKKAESTAEAPKAEAPADESAVKAAEIGQAMLEVTTRGDEFDNGDKLGTFSIMRYADAYARRQQTAGE